MIELANHKKLMVWLFVVNLGLVFFPLLVDILFSDSGRILQLANTPSALSALLLPFSAGFLVMALSKKQALWTLSGLIAISLLGFMVWGIGFLFLVPIWVGLMLPAATRTWWSWILAIIVMLFGIVALLPGGGGVGPRAYAANDLSNVKQICLNIDMYRESHAKFPDRLSQLQEVSNSLRIFVSPRRRRDLVTHGPLRVWLDKSDPGPRRKITSWEEVDGGDYLYRKPPQDAPGSMIMVMTRPGLLDHNWVNIGFVDTHVERFEADVWKLRADVTEFLKQTGATP